MTTTFFRLLSQSDKGAALKEAVARHNTGGTDSDSAFVVDPESFRKVPNTPFAYWVDDSIRELFQRLPPFESEGRTVKQGLATADDFRFVRSWWEVPAERRLDAGLGPDWRGDLAAFQEWCRDRTCEGSYWVPFAKGGEYSPYYADIHLVVNWKGDGAEMKAWADPLYGNSGWSRIIKSVDFYFRPGLTWPLRASRYNPWPLPAATIFSVRGYSIFVRANEMVAIFDLFNSDTWDFLHKMFVGRYGHPEFLVGTASLLPFPSLSLFLGESLQLSLKVLSLFSLDEGAASFAGVDAYKDTAWIDPDALIAAKKRSEFVAMSTFNLPEASRARIAAFELERLGQAGKLESQALIALLPKKRERSLLGLSYLLGLAFGRWDLRMALDPSLVPKLADPFDPLPVCPPASLVGPDGLPARSGGIASEEWLRARPNAIGLPAAGSVEKATIADGDYPIPISWDGILVDDRGHPEDLVARVRKVMELLWKERAFAMEQELCDALGARSLEEYLRKPGGFFADHLARYSKSRRKAPIYWPLSTASGSYTLWIYYPRLAEDTLYLCVNRYLTPRLEAAEKELAEVRALREREATSEVKRRFDELTSLAGELEELRAELLRVAALPYRPNLDDGVVICAAPLRRLFRLPKWRKELEARWKELEGGKYDWAHVALAIWPDRVRERCRTDRSIAIAHGLEELCEAVRRDESPVTLEENLEDSPDGDDEDEK